MIDLAFLCWREIRALFRILRTGLHLCYGVMTVLLVFPLASLSLKRRLKQRWSRQLVEALGVDIDIAGHPTPAGLVIANHISFVDIFALNAVAPAAFVSKDDVLDWPLIGWLSARNETLFMARGSRRAAQRTKEHLVEELRNGTLVALFPEGTTSPGDHVLPFHSALFQSAIDAGAPVSPMVLCYGEGDVWPSAAPAYVGETSLLSCLWSIARQDDLQVRVRCLPRLSTTEIDRRHLSAHAHRAVAHELNALLTTSRAQPVPGRAAERPLDPQAATR